MWWEIAGKQNCLRIASGLARFAMTHLSSFFRKEVRSAAVAAPEDWRLAMTKMDGFFLQKTALTEMCSGAVELLPMVDEGVALSRVAKDDMPTKDYN
jgi:hypothetical protein